MKRAAGCVALALCLVCCPASSQEKGKEKAAPTGKEKAAPEAYAGPKWEYRLLAKREVAKLAGGDMRAGLNKLGEEGWELVALGAARGDELYFKRPGRAASRPAGAPAAADAKQV